jgi:hypothetical protein
MVEQIESQNKLDKISASYIHHETYNLPAGHHQQYANPGSNRSKILGFIPRPKLTWQKHVKSKRQKLNLKLRKISWFLGRKSKLSVQNKFLLYKFIIKPIWTYGIQLWGCTKPSNAKII